MTIDCDLRVPRRLQSDEMSMLLKFYLEELTEVDCYWRFFRTMTGAGLRLYVDQLPFKGSGAVYGLVCGARLVAAAEVDLHGDGCADVGIAVSQHHRRKGFGRELLEHVLSELPGLGARRARMSYLSRNHPLAALAARLGFGPAHTEGDVVFVERALS